MIDLSHHCCGHGWSPGGRVCPGYPLVCEPPTSVGVRASHLGVSVCPRGGTCGVTLHFCLVVSAAYCRAVMNVFRVWLVVAARLGFWCGVRYYIRTYAGLLIIVNAQSQTIY